MLVMIYDRCYHHLGIVPEPKWLAVCFQAGLTRRLLGGPVSDHFSKLFVSWCVSSLPGYL